MRAPSGMNCQRPAAPAGEWIVGSNPLSTRESQRMSSGMLCSRRTRRIAPLYRPLLRIHVVTIDLPRGSFL